MKRPTASARARVAGPLLAAAFGLHLDASAAERAPACLVKVSVEPSRAVPGQQLLYRLQILRHESVSEVHWFEPLTFPAFRAEWLPGRSPDPSISGIGPNYLVFEERRALFPARAGRLEIPAGRLRCTVAEEVGRRDVIVPVPPAVVEVTELPKQGRPPGFSGIVGGIRVRSIVVPSRIRLGESVRLTVIVRGPANVWRTASLLQESNAVAGVEVFPHPPELSFEAGARLQGRLSLRFDLVPRREGELVIPELRVPYFDADRRLYALAKAPPVTLSVEGEVRADVEARGETEGQRATPGPRGAPPADRRAWILALGALGAGGGLTAWMLVRRGRRAETAVRALLADAERAHRRGELAAESSALASALRAALERRVPGARALSAPEILTQVREDVAARDAADLLARLDEARFATEGSTVPDAPQAPDAVRVRDAVRALRPRTRPRRRALSDPG